MKQRKIRVATRKSPLAMRQTELAVAFLSGKFPDWTFEIIPMSTTGDERLAWSLETSGGKGLFTSALEEAIVREEADLAVHSSKDLPTEMPEGIDLAGFLPRAPAEDVLIVRKDVSVPSMIATSSPRRRAQLKRIYPKAAWKEIRGNVQTRLRKIVEGHADATVMAMAGLFRMDLLEPEGLRLVKLPVHLSVPAAGQGAIGFQTRSSDAETFRDVLCAETAEAVNLERLFLSAMGGGCHSATAAHFCNGILHIFHEGVGYRQLEISDDFKEMSETKRREWLKEQVS